MYQTENVFYPTGWVCPKCGRVYNPTTTMCYYCEHSSEITSVPNTTGAKLDYQWKDYIITISSDLPITLSSSDIFRVHYEDLPRYKE